MSDTGSLTKLQSSASADICQSFKLTEPLSLQLLNNYSKAEDFLEKLIENKLYIDAVKFLTHALPKQEAIWWVCLCFRQSDNHLTGNEKILGYAEEWVKKPTDELRRELESSNQPFDYTNPLTWLILSIFWSEGSLTAPNEPVVLPAPTLTAQATAGAIMLAAVLKEPDKANSKYGAYLKLGIRIARGSESYN